MNDVIRRPESVETNQESQDAESSFAFDSLESLRKRLLDLTARNRLLNYRFSKTGQVRIIDELPDQLAELLITEHRLTFQPVPEPSLDELISAGYISIDEMTGEHKRIKADPDAVAWAKVLGFDTNYELPSDTGSTESKHNDTAIQTLMFPPELEARLKGLRTKAVTAIEETGSNFLYIAFGFLEWYESKDSDSKRLAPLFLIPVNLEKGKLDPETKRYLYYLSYTGEDIIPNLSLQEKLRIDFGLGLPDLEENPTPEAFFSSLTSIIDKAQPRWQVRRQCALTLLEFGNLLMYLDLDPANWPDGPGNIAKHSIVSRFFSSTETTIDGAGSFSDEYLIDDIENVHDKFPLIDDADSSQHSAIVDAINGRNLVIEGPPGTGKSQTITNIIAAAISQGKTVLFVAEKLAALEVVKRRLDNANLGDFCLELHSHKTQKRKLLDDINQRLLNQTEYQSPNQMQADVERYENLKSKLNSYANLINEGWKNTGLNIHQILNRAVRYRDNSTFSSLDLRPNNIFGDTFTASLLREAVDNIRLYRDVYQRVSEQLGSTNDISSHPWHGAENTNLQIFDTLNVVEKLDEWTVSLSDLFNSITLTNQTLPVNHPLKGINNAEYFITSVASLPDLQGNEYLPALSKLKEKNLEDLESFIKLTDTIQTLFTELSPQINHVYLDKLEKVDSLKTANKALLSLGINQNMPLGDVAKTLQKIEILQRKIQKISTPIEELSARLGSDFTSHITISIRGLDEYSILLKLINELPVELLKHRNILFDDDELDSVLNLIHSDLEQLTPQYEKAESLFNISQISNSAELIIIRDNLESGGIFKWFKSNWRKSKHDLLSLSADKNHDISKLSQALPEFIKFYDSYQDFLNNKKYIKLLGDHFSGLDTQIKDLKVLRQWYAKVRSTYGIGFGARAGLGSTLFNMVPDIAKGLQVLANQELTDEITSIHEDIEQIRCVIPNDDVFRDDSQLLFDADSTNGLQRTYQKLAKELEPCQASITSTTLSLAGFQVSLNRLDTLKEYITQWYKAKVLLQLFDFNVDIKIGRIENTQESLSILQNTATFAKYLSQADIAPQVKIALEDQPSISTIEHLQKSSNELETSCTTARLKEQCFSEMVSLNSTVWHQGVKDDIEALIERNRYAASQPDWLATWVDFVRFRQVVEQLGFRNLLARIEEGLVNIQDIEDALHFGIYDHLSREVFKERPELSQLSGQVQSAIQVQFREYDEALKSLQQKKIAYLASRKSSPTGNSGGKVSSYTELSLLRHEIGKKSRHIPIRQMIKRAGKALNTLKPCFMMGPKSVAQYLPAGLLEFDLVIIDEASQVKPQDALGAIARGKQFVVVGDPKQLPPTSFFDKMNEEDENEEIAGIQQSESVLGAAVPLFPMRRLRWHYRSQHESLIAFSNHSFYDSNLVVFPSPNSSSPDYGVKFHRVNRGRFVNQRNIEEARVIAQSVSEHLINRPDESLGVVAMSANQREQIDRSIEEIAKNNPLLQEALEQNQEKSESLFIKNLENVQGDERDVIYISCTYGPHDAEGKLMFQRFGPINSDVGWRRLNVLFTRSKKRMHIFSSMDPDHIQISEKSSRGVRALKAFLAYAKTGHIHQPQLTGKAPDSDFEIAVAKSLSNYGFECVPQVGVAGFFIDLAIKDPGKPGSFLMGIECDGATYHSGKSARDRDRLRQTVLERLGWNIRRIWSTDWFKNPEAQIRPIVEELNKLKTETSLVLEEPETADIDEIITVEDSIDTSTDNAIRDSFTLKDKLIDFDQKIIRLELPDVENDKRILRPAMLEALLHSRPMDMFEFQEQIAGYLRADTDSSEGRFLPEILRVIAEDEGFE